MLRKTIPVARRVLGENDDRTLKMRLIYARALYKDPGATLDDLREAVTTLEEAERTARRVLGGAHPLTVTIEEICVKTRALRPPAVLIPSARGDDAGAQAVATPCTGTPYSTVVGTAVDAARFGAGAGFGFAASCPSTSLIIFVILGGRTTPRLGRIGRLHGRSGVQPGARRTYRRRSRYGSLSLFGSPTTTACRLRWTRRARRSPQRAASASTFCLRSRASIFSWYIFRENRLDVV